MKNVKLLIDDDYNSDFNLNPYDCGMLNSFELYNVHSYIVKMEKWPIRY